MKGAEMQRGREPREEKEEEEAEDEEEGGVGHDEIARHV